MHFLIFLVLLRVVFILLRSHTHASRFFADNPVLCDDGLADLTVALEVNHAKIYGRNTCPITTTSQLPPTLLLAAAAAASGGNVSFAATLE